ncbi:response regulator transcription factor [Streptomyces sp. NPDC020377]|uniref:response regulator transcription factor n=1 Tax=Streptomyces sp. NPDC020377 TaxID=3365070 RepID=UPI00378CB3AE
MRIVISGEENLLNDTLHAVLTSQRFLTVTAAEAKPDIIIRIHTQGSESVEFLHNAANSGIRVPILVLAERVPDSDVRQILAMGAAGILLRDTAARHIPWAIPAISNGCRVVSPEISESMISEYLRNDAMTPQEESARERICRLSRREHEVLHLLSRGMSNREIAGTLFISPETVKDHVRAIRSKLGAPTRVQAAHVAWLARIAATESAA